MAQAKISEVWSYSTGERGRNRVRAYERAPRGNAGRGLVFLQFVGLVADGTQHRKRVSPGVCSREEAKAKADALAAKFAETGRPVERQLNTVAQLFDNYVREVTPSKSRHAQTHDRATAALFVRLVGRKRLVASLNRRDWDKFIRDRRTGVLRPRAARKDQQIRDRIVQYDCKTILAVLNWGMTVNDARGEPLVARNPFRGLPIPREESPRRPQLSEADYQALLGKAADVHWQFRLALVLAHETGHRVSAIRMLRWSDVDLKGRRIRWRAENDKIGFEHTTPNHRASGDGARGGAVAHGGDRRHMGVSGHQETRVQPVRPDDVPRVVGPGRGEGRTRAGRATGVAFTPSEVRDGAQAGAAPRSRLPGRVEVRRHGRRCLPAARR